jgi:hypothetical protein
VKDLDVVDDVVDQRGRDDLVAEDHDGDRQK